MLYEKNVLETLQRQKFTAGNEEILFHSSESGSPNGEGTLLSGNSNWFGYVQKEPVKLFVSCGKVKACLNENDIKGFQNALVLCRSTRAKQRAR